MRRRNDIVNTAVRNTWELNTDQFELRNTKWADIIDTILEAIRVPLGINEHTEYHAKLYKMLLYEEGGKFHRHQDSEKEEGMFGTLVVMLPCHFEGGELHVHHPAAKSEPHVWAPGAMSTYDLKYAAFYGDCDHEVKPVTGGHRLCLTYNLVTVSKTEMPRFAGNHQLYANLEKALSSFFTEQSSDPVVKRPRTSIVHRSSHERDCQLVYMLEHKYTNPGLSFLYLKNKDHSVAQSLAKFCEDSEGAYSLYLCKVRYTYEYDPDCEDLEPERTVLLQSPWVKYGELLAAPCQDMTASIEKEIAPAGFFEEVPFDGFEDLGFTGNRGAEWYTSAALVLQPLKIELKQIARAGMDYAVNKWVKLVESGSPHAQTFASRLFSTDRTWSTTDACFILCLRAVRKLNSVGVFGDVLHRLSNIAIQEALATAVDHFGWNSCRDTIFEVARSSSFRNRVNLTCSILHDCDDLTRIEEVLTNVALKPNNAAADSQGGRTIYNSYQRPAAKLTGEDYGRLLALAYRLSIGTLVNYVEASDTTTLIKLIGPAMVSLMSQYVEKPDDMATVARGVIHQLQQRMPRASPTYCCGYCVELQAFLNNATQQVLRITMSMASRHDAHKVIERYCGDRLSHITDRPSTLVMTKLLPEVDLHDTAQQVLRRLPALVDDAGHGSVGPPVRAVPATADVIEIDSE